MAFGEHSRVRRALLGAAVAAPIAAGQALSLPLLSQRAPPCGAAKAASGGGSQAPHPVKGEGKWLAALARLSVAEAAMRAAEAAGAAVPGRARSFAAQWALDEAFSDAVVAFNAALQRMLLAPAPDLAALAFKIGRAIDEQAWELPRGEACMAAVKRDLGRLIG